MRPLRQDVRQLPELRQDGFLVLRLPRFLPVFLLHGPLPPLMPLLHRIPHPGDLPDPPAFILDFALNIPTIFSFSSLVAANSPVHDCPAASSMV